MCVVHDVWIQLYQLISNLQAVVVSIDPRRVYVKDPNDVQLKTIRVSSQGEVLSFLLCFPLIYCYSIDLYAVLYIGAIYFCGKENVLKTAVGEFVPLSSLTKKPFLRAV